MCFSCRGGPKWAPHTLGGASVGISWQEGRLDDKYSNSHPDAGSHPEAYSHQDASSHPEAKLHPEAELLKEGNLHPEWIYIRKWTCWRWRTKSYIRKVKAISQRVQESDCTNVQKCQLLFRSLLCRVNLRQSQPCSLKVLGEHLSKWGKIGAKVKFKSGGLIKGNFGSTITWRKRRNL